MRYHFAAVRSTRVQPRVIGTAHETSPRCCAPPLSRMPAMLSGMLARRLRRAMRASMQFRGDPRSAIIPQPS